MAYCQLKVIDMVVRRHIAQKHERPDLAHLPMRCTDLTRTYLLSLPAVFRPDKSAALRHLPQDPWYLR